MSMQSPVPSFDKLAAALELLAVPTSTIQSFCGKTHDNIAWEFTQALRVAAGHRNRLEIPSQRCAPRDLSSLFIP